MVRINIVGGGFNESIEYSDGSNTKAVKDDLLGGYGKGILKVNGMGVLTETLDADEYEYYITQQGENSLPVFIRHVCTTSAYTVFSSVAFDFDFPVTEFTFRFIIDTLYISIACTLYLFCF
jgi:hypothetical protein